jgi:hypothetical protein
MEMKDNKTRGGGMRVRKERKEGQKKAWNKRGKMQNPKVLRAKSWDLN